MFPSAYTQQSQQHIQKILKAQPKKKNLSEPVASASLLFIAEKNNKKLKVS